MGRQRECRRPVAAFIADRPGALSTPILELGNDARIRTALGRVYHLSRSTGRLSVIDPRSWQVEQVFDLGVASQLRDVAIINASTAYLTRRNASSLRRLDLDTGVASEVVDLSELGAGSGDRTQATLLRDEGRLWVQLPGAAVFPPVPHFLAVIEIATETLIDADPASGDAARSASGHWAALQDATDSGTLTHPDPECTFSDLNRESEPRRGCGLGPLVVLTLLPGLGLRSTVPGSLGERNSTRRIQPPRSLSAGSSADASR